MPLIITPEFQAALDGFVAAWSKMREEHYSTHYTSVFAEPLEVQYGSKFAHVIKRHANGVNFSAGAFIALCDFNTNKALGPVKMGNIHKPATWKMPAKHARGNILTPDFGMSCMTDYGPNYLR